MEDRLVIAQQAGAILAGSALARTIRRASSAIPAPRREQAAAGVEPPTTPATAPKRPANLETPFARPAASASRAMEALRSRPQPPARTELSVLRAERTAPARIPLPETLPTPPARAGATPFREFSAPRPVVLRVDFDYHAGERLQSALAEIIGRAAEEAVAGLLGAGPRGRYDLA